MAVTTSRLSMTFGTSTGDEVSFGYSYADEEASIADIKALVAGMIANGSIFKKVPAVAKSAKIVTTTTTPISLS